ncbi:MAG TPA: electron transfer flavoprotein subunit alpha/FixB family protein [Chloroflexota bacterium]|jgi:electron transfer flavoprotein alpha subunit|nr:electron transfer flavoprotein subunit alpha/FixB family protein [Chloroflexota bacterium]
MPGVLLITEAAGEQLAGTTAELIGEGTRLAQQLGGAPVTVLLAGKNVQGLASSLGPLGVDQVLVADSQAPTPPSPQWLLAAAEAAAKQIQPDVILLTHAGGSRDLGAALAYRLDSGIVTDSTALRVEGSDVIITKPVFGGSALAEFSISSSPKVVTLRPRAFESDEAPVAGEAQVEALSVPETDGAIEVLEEIREQATTGPRLKDAKVIVSGGRGLGGPDNWKVVEELAQILGGAVGATRAVTDAGWVPPSLQVGLTGATVAPDLYITIGISGAVQHIAGISGARNVVAINRDADANIFKYARFGVVGDWKQIVPAFTQRLKELRG